MNESRNNFSAGQSAKKGVRLCVCANDSNWPYYEIGYFTSNKNLPNSVIRPWGTIVLKL